LPSRCLWAALPGLRGFDRGPAEHVERPQQQPAARKKGAQQAGAGWSSWEPPPREDSSPQRNPENALAHSDPPFWVPGRRKARSRLKARNQRRPEWCRVSPLDRGEQHFPGPLTGPPAGRRGHWARDGSKLWLSEPEFRCMDLGAGPAGAAWQHRASVAADKPANATRLARFSDSSSSASSGSSRGGETDGGVEDRQEEWLGLGAWNKW
jgi:hypothetical protein